MKMIIIIIMLLMTLICVHYHVGCGDYDDDDDIVTRMPVTPRGKVTGSSLSLSSLLRNNPSCASALDEEGPTQGIK